MLSGLVAVERLERRILSTLLLDNSAMKIVIGKLLARNFTDKRHQKIYFAMTHLYIDKWQIDLVTISHTLDAMGDRDLIPASYLASFVDGPTLLGPEFLRAMCEHSYLGAEKVERKKTKEITPENLHELYDN